MKYYIIAGEASGDLHGSNLMKGIYAEDPQAEIRFWGGDLMFAVWDSFQNNPSHTCGLGPSPCGQGGSTVLKPAPDLVHAVAAPEADFRLGIFGVYAFHKV